MAKNKEAAKEVVVLLLPFLQRQRLLLHHDDSSDDNEDDGEGDSDYEYSHYKCTWYPSNYCNYNFHPIYSHCYCYVTHCCGCYVFCSWADDLTMMLLH